jgi:hypothetical protein
LVAYELKVALEVFTFDNHRASAIIGVKTERLGLQEVLVKEQDDMVLLVINQTKRADTTGL